MNDLPRPPLREPGCPAQFTLEACAAGEVSLPHLETCDACRKTVSELQAQAQAFIASRSPAVFLAQVDARVPTPGPRWFHWWKLAALAGAGAVALVVLLVLSNRPVDEVSLKGSAFRVVVKRAPSAAVEALRDGALVAPGEVLRFSYQTTQPGQLLVLEKEAAGPATVFWPFGAVHSGRVDPGSAPVLPGAVELDSATGEATVYAVFRATPIDAAPLLEQLRLGSEPSCEGCVVNQLRYRKVTR